MVWRPVEMSQPECLELERAWIQRLPDCFPFAFSVVVILVCPGSPHLAHMREECLEESAGQVQKEERPRWVQVELLSPCLSASAAVALLVEHCALLLVAARAAASS